MIRKPKLADEMVIQKLKKDYSLGVTDLTFLPIGEGSWCYKATSGTGENFFIKLSSNKLYKPSVIIPTYLRNQLLMEFVIPALADNRQTVIDTLDEYTIVVYPFIEATSLRSTTITAQQWEQVGKYLWQLHTVSLPADMQKDIYKESFIPRWGEEAKKVLAESEKEQTEPYAKELAQFIKSKKDTITKIIRRTYELGEMIAKQQPELVLCHSDIHTDNMLVTETGQIYFIDWDFIQIAPIERDLMFFMGKEHSDFMKGYDPEHTITHNRTILAYYNYEWVVQEIRDYESRVFFEALDEKSKQHALEEFCKLFEPNNVIEAAYKAIPYPQIFKVITLLC